MSCCQILGGRFDETDIPRLDLLRSGFVDAGRRAFIIMTTRIPATLVPMFCPCDPPRERKVLTR